MLAVNVQELALCKNLHPELEYTAGQPVNGIAATRGSRSTLSGVLQPGSAP
jgi:hypothetical protein